MKIAVYYPNKFPAFSIKIYTDILIEKLSKLGVECIKFTTYDSVKEKVNVIWDTQTGGGNPTFLDKRHNTPTVITMHGAALFSLPIKDNIYKLKTALRIILNRHKYKKIWNKKANFVDGIITVSEYGKSEAKRYLNFSEDLMTPIYHGVDFDFFHSNKTTKIYKTKTFLHISQFQPKKNLSRIIDGFIIATNKFPEIKLKIICPGFPEMSKHNNIEIISTYVDRKKITEYYQNSFAFIFPSLHETFGLPILEAMASGLPVITSKTTACGEIGGKNAILVNPYNVADISNAITELVKNEKLHEQLSIKGIEYSKNFTWEKSAIKHLELFKQIIKQ